MLALAILTWNCVAYSYTIRNLYKRIPVDRASQAQFLHKRAKISPSNYAQSRQTPVEPSGAPIPTLSSSAKKAVTNVRNELSNLGGSIIGGFTGLTGLKLKDYPGFDLPSIAPRFPEPGIRSLLTNNYILIKLNIRQWGNLNIIWHEFNFAMIHAFSM